MTLPTAAATIGGIVETSPAVIGDKTSVVRLSDELKEWQAGQSPGGAAVFDTGPIQLRSGSVAIWAHRIGRQVNVRIQTAVTGLTGDVVNIEGGAAIIPADLRPPFDVTGSLIAAAPSGGAVRPGALVVGAGGNLALVMPDGGTDSPSGSATYFLAS